MSYLIQEDSAINWPAKLLNLPIIPVIHIVENNNMRILNHTWHAVRPLNSASSFLGGKNAEINTTNRNGFSTWNRYIYSIM